MRFRPKRRHAPPEHGGAGSSGPDDGPEGVATEPPEDAAAGGAERRTAVEWARKHQINSVMAERAAMYAGKRDEPVTEAEFLQMIRRRDV